MINIISTISADREALAGKAVARVILVTGFVIMTALGAYIRIPIPFSPVPITLQTFFVILCGAVLGKKLGFFAQVSYVGLGALGMPVFQGYGAGLLHLAGPTGGYLAGFAVAAFLVGALMDKKDNRTGFVYTLLAMTLGLFSIYTCGVAWLMIGHKMEFARALALGFVPFIPGAIAKLFAAAWIYSKVSPKTNPITR